MRNRGTALLRLCVLALTVCALAFAGPPMTRITLVVKARDGHPVDRAGIIVNFIEGHSVVKLGKAVRQTYELRTNQEGEASIPPIPQGKIKVQVIAKGFQTFGQVFDITEENKKLDITMNPPQQQYTAH
ncbi:MAG: carboxypeptidase regulatory-like domain-containing protein [Acidobacteriota bacterium]|nr:carboxypeptidase regulatory-like domain-containing protein [Acidobacteriota bacterium]